jgi:hypothetical protein
MLLNSISFDLHCVLFTFSNNCATFGISQMIEKNGNKMVLYNIIFGFGVPVNLFRLI